MERIKEIYNYRQMIFRLVRKDLRGRYKGSVLGFFWTFLNPLLQLLVYTMVFSVIMRSGIDKYYLFLFVALVPWIYFSSSLTGGATSILGSGDMVKKIYFPREVMPIAYMTSSFVNMLLSFLVVFAVLIVTGYGVNLVAMLYLPIIMIVEYTGSGDCTSDLCTDSIFARSCLYSEYYCHGMAVFDTGHVLTGDGVGCTGILSDAGAHLESESDDTGYQRIQGYPVL